MKIDFNQTEDTNAFFDLPEHDISGHISAKSEFGDYHIKIYNENEIKDFDLEKLENMIGIEANNQILFYREYWYTDEVLTDYFPFEPEDRLGEIHREEIILENSKRYR